MEKSCLHQTLFSQKKIIFAQDYEERKGIIRGDEYIEENRHIEEAGTISAIRPRDTAWFHGLRLEDREGVFLRILPCGLLHLR